MAFRLDSRLCLIATVVCFAGCLQLDQTLPLDVDAGTTATKNIGPSGGVVSVPPDFSMKVPAGALGSSASITVQQRLSSPFPSDAGSVLPGTSYDISPAGLTLAQPATVELRVPESLLEAGDDVKLGIAILGNDGSVATSVGAYDATAGILRATVTQLGPVAAVVELDAIDVETGLPPDLDGGNFGGSASGVSGLVDASNPRFKYSSSCAPSARRCFSSGLVRAWVSSNLESRLGTKLAILSPKLTAELDFGGFDGSGQPTVAVGSVSITGSLKARVGQAVTSYAVDEHRVTGTGGSARETGVAVNGKELVFDAISGGSNRQIKFGLTRIATGEMLTLQLVEEVEVENDDGSKTVGTVTLHVRLRR